MKSNVYSILFIILFCVIFSIIVLNKSSYYESFTWSTDDKNDFIQLQFTINPKIIYDIKTLQKYASSKDVKYLLEHGLWPWSEVTQDLYKKALDKNPFVRTYSEDGVNYARSIYNESAILYILKGQKEAEEKSKQVKPDSILPSGWGSFGYNSGLI